MIRLRTGYSFRGAYGMIDNIMPHVEGDYAPITDRASSYGWARWRKASKDAGKTPVFGVELAVSPAPDAKRPAFDYWVFFSKWETLHPINHLIRLAYRNFRYRPLLPIADALSAEGVMFSVGRRTPKVWLEGLQCRGEGYYCLAPGLPPAHGERYASFGLRPALAFDNVYTQPGDEGVYDIIGGREAETQSWPRHIMGQEELCDYLEREGHSFKRIAQGSANAEFILETASRATLDRAELPRPAKVPGSLEELCREGILKNKMQFLWGGDYEARLEKELDLIQRKGYEDYFYIVADICSWARERMLVGPARGSSCGSLVCYLLGITTVDPLPHGLIFERFVDINRDDMPDIDIDFPEHRREEVIDYIRDTYGRERVSRLGTVAVFRPRSALNEAGAALNVPKNYIAPVLDAVIERSSGDARALDTLEDTLREMDVGKMLLREHPDILVATKMEGHPSHASTHASAVVLTREPLEEYAPINERDGVLMLDKADAEELNILKVDALGLTQLSVLEYAMELAEQDPDLLYEIPLDDPKTMEIFQKRKYSGIFQFGGAALMSVAKLVEMRSFEDICAITALARPGPLVSGGAENWANKHSEPEKAKAEIPELLRPMLSDTMGVVVYQEQVMQIGRDIGGLDWGDVTALRKAMSKSLGKEYFDQYGDRWKPGAIEKGMDPEYAEQLWTDMCAFGSWAFNKSHSVAYGLISYWCAWVKARWPVQFAAATLTYEKDIERQRQILRELVSEGVGYIPFDLEKSIATKWQVDGKRVVGPLVNIKGVAAKTAERVLRARARGDTLPDSLRKRLEGGETPLDTLYPVRDAYARILPDPTTRNIMSAPVPIAEIEEYIGDNCMVVATPIRINPRDANEEINIAKRDGKRIEGEPTAYLTLRLRDDSGELLAIVNRWKYAKVGAGIVHRGGAGKALYAVKGDIIEYEKAVMMMVTMVRYIGEI